MNMFGNLTTVVKNLLIINVLFWLGTILMNRMGMDLSMYLGGFYPGSPAFMPWQIVSHMFMHSAVDANGNIVLFHIFFNMFALFIFGTTLEKYWGSKRFLIYYMVSGIGAYFFYFFINGIQLYQFTGSFFPAIEAVNMAGRSAQLIYYVPVVGASGAVFGILLAFGMLFPNTQLMLLFPPIPIKAKYFVMIYGAIELYSGLANNPGDNVAHFAHLGGMLFGFILIKYWQKNSNSFY
jgi:membrane associated rhomboid family serine protease